MVVFYESIKKPCFYYIILNITLSIIGLNSSTTSKIHIGNCTKWQFQCHNSQCVHKSFLCDGIPDCFDHSDETHKQCQNMICDGNKFQCNYGACIDNEYLCDGLNQCNDGSDELPKNCEQGKTTAVHRKIKRQTNHMCAVPLPFTDKTITYKCGSQEETDTCEQNGFVHDSTIALIKCNPDYYLVNKNATFYRSICVGKTWTPPIEECFKPCEETIPINVGLRCYRKGMEIPCDNTIIVAGTKIRIRPTCNMVQGYEEYAGKHPEITCQNNGTWNKPLIICTPEEDVCNHTEGQSCIKIQDCPAAKIVKVNKKQVFCGLHNGNAGKICCTLSNSAPKKTLSSPLNISQLYLSFTNIEENLLNTTQLPINETKSSANNSTSIVLSYCEKISSINETECVNDQPSIGERKTALPAEYPHVAYLGIDDASKSQQYKWCCVGTLISEKFILSVAACCADYLERDVDTAVLGYVNYFAAIEEREQAMFKIVKRYYHPNFHLRTYHNDIGLYQLETPIQFDSSIRPACLYPFDLSREINTDKFIITGWGAKGLAADSFSDNLMKATITVVNGSHCSTIKNWDYDPDSMMCVGQASDGEAFCTHTIGSPIQLRMNNKSCIWTTFGMWSLFLGPTPPSCEDTSPATSFIYTKISHHLDWIQSIVWP